MQRCVRQRGAVSEWEREALAALSKHEREHWRRHGAAFVQMRTTMVVSEKTISVDPLPVAAASCDVGVKTCINREEYIKS